MAWFPEPDTWYEDAGPRSAVREYSSLEAMRLDAERAAEHGWRIISTSELQQRAGCMRILTLGLFALLWKPKSHIMATYTRD